MARAHLAAALQTIREIGDSAALDAALERESDSRSIVLEKELGATRIVDADTLDLPPWTWPAR
jgi:hypothetical protein